MLVFEKCPIVSAYTELIMELLREATPGFVILWDELEVKTGTDRSNQKFATALANARKRATVELSMTLVSQRGVGYLVSPPKEWNRDIVRPRMKRSSNQIKKAAHSMAYLNVSDIPERERMAAIVASQAMQALSRETKGMWIATRDRMERELAPD